MKPRTVIITLHDLNLISRFADQVGLLVGGKLAALGTPAEILNAELLSRAYNLPLKVIHQQGQLLVIPADTALQVDG